MIFNTLYHISEYIQQNFASIFEKKIKLSPIMPIYDFYYEYDHTFYDTPLHITIIPEFLTQEELDALV